MERNDNWDSYFIPNTNVLKNNLGITDKKELEQAEIDISFLKNLELYEEPIKGDFDEEHLKNIHKYLFGEIYPFAGVYRTVYMLKADSFYFVAENDIEMHLENVLKEMHKDIINCSDYSSFVGFLALYYYDLLTIHPFREGNGRTIREFLREFVLEYMPEYNLDWSKLNKKELDEAIKVGFLGKSLLELQFAKALVKNEEVLRTPKKI